MVADGAGYQQAGEMPEKTISQWMQLLSKCNVPLLACLLVEDV